MHSLKTVAFHTLGCKLNFAETSTIARQMEIEGFERKNFDDGADVYVINTCSVTENADKECKKIIRKALRYSPDARIVITGCYAQLKPKEIAEIEGVDLVLGAKEKFQLIDYLRLLPDKKSPGSIVHSCEIQESNLFTASYSFGERTRAFLKVQDGCDYNCTYCTIPLARGKSRSDSIANAVKNARLLGEMGAKEIVLTGVNIGDFGFSELKAEKKLETFFDLIQALDKVENVNRFRISSIEPNLLKNEIIEFVSKSKRFMPHFHIPLQAGSDTILKLMKRRYLTDLYKNRIEKIKSLMPDCCIGADVIVGFPGETNELFLETYQFLQSLPVSYLHVFTYSERDNTEAIHLSNVIPMNVRHERNKMLRILSEKKRIAFYASQLGKFRPVLFENATENDEMEGFTDNYVKVKMDADVELQGEISLVRLDEMQNDFVLGKIKSAASNPALISV
jgi:threonylcarbamoyladenosine tRNA methylthiotransferase MtaB